MSVPELPYRVSDHPLDCLNKTTTLIDDLRSYLNKLHKMNQFMYNCMVTQLQNIKHQSQPQTVPYPFQVITLLFRQTINEQNQMMYNYIVFKLQIKYMVNTLHERNILQLNKVIYHKSLVSYDLDPVQAITQGFSKPSNHDPHTSPFELRRDSSHPSVVILNLT